MQAGRLSAAFFVLPFHLCLPGPPLVALRETEHRHLAGETESNDMADEAQNENESSVIKELRQQLKDANARLKTLEPMARQSAFKEAGIDVSSGPGKFFAEKYDGELTADAIREAAEPYGFIGQQAAEEQQPSGPDEQQQRMGELRSASTPEGAGKRLSFTEWQELSKADPAAAREAHDSGRVDIPSYIASSLAAS